MVVVPDLVTGRRGLTSQEQLIPLTIDKEPAPFHLGGGLLPVPGKLVKKIEKGRFIDMAELLPEHLSSQWEGDDQSKSTKPKCKAVTNILEWLQCFGIYVAIISRKELHWVVDMLAYQHLVI